MKVYLRRIGRTEYYKNATEWTRAQHEARAFTRTAEALAFAQADCLRDCEVVLSFGDPRYDIALPCLGNPTGNGHGSTGGLDT
jgi:hypothetical protein